MSKDKGSKNKKKAPADKNSGKTKVQSSYQEENKKGNQNTTLDAFAPKTEGKGSGKDKSDKT